MCFLYPRRHWFLYRANEVDIALQNSWHAPILQHSLRVFGYKSKSRYCWQFWKKDKIKIFPPPNFVLLGIFPAIHRCCWQTHWWIICKTSRNCSNSTSRIKKINWWGILQRRKWFALQKRMSRSNYRADK